MARYHTLFEIHLHGEVVLRPEVGYTHLQDALKPLWKYTGAKSLTDASDSFYEDEPGIHFETGLLQICWTVEGDEDFRQALDEMCMNLNELASTGAAIEVTFYDTRYDDDDNSMDDADSMDDFFILFVGPTPAAIMQVQRNLLVQDVLHLMERHFDASELGGVIHEIDRLFLERYDNLTAALHLSRLPKTVGNSGHSGGRKPRHLH